MISRPPTYNRHDPLFPYLTLFLSMQHPSLPTTERAWRLMTGLRRCARRGSRRDPTARTAALSMRVWPVPVATADGRSLHCGSERLGDTAGDHSGELLNP